MENKTRTWLAVAIAFLLAGTFASGFGVALATTQGSTNASVSTAENETATTSDAIPLSKEPFLVENGKTVAATPINQTHVRISLAGNGILSPPNSTETIRTNDTGNALIRLTPAGDIAQGQIHLKTEDGSENATVFFTEISLEGRGIGVAYFSTNSTGKLAFLNNTVAVFQDELRPDGTTVITAWKWGVQ
jgi:hypothetical protein